jgi:Zn-dependent protease
MALITVQEIIDLVIMVAAIGFIFKDAFVIRGSTSEEYDPVAAYKRSASFLGEGFRNGIIVAAPAVVLHEAGHKITALMFGLEATFHAAYTWLGIGVVLKALNFPFIFFVPGYVTYSGTAEPIWRALIAFSGPAVNLGLFLFAVVALKQGWLRKHTALLVMTKQINLFLFIFNMLPFGFFDGAHVVGGMLAAF